MTLRSSLTTRLDKLISAVTERLDSSHDTQRRAEYSSLLETYQAYADWIAKAHDCELERIAEAIKSTEDEFFGGYHAADEEETLLLERAVYKSNQSASPEAAILRALLEWLYEPLKNKYIPSKDRAYKQVAMRSAIGAYLTFEEAPDVPPPYASLAHLGRAFGDSKSNASKVARSFTEQFGRISPNKVMSEAYREAAAERQRKVWQARNQTRPIDKATFS